MDESGKNGFSNNGETHTWKEIKNSQRRGVIAWGDREYGLEEFRSLMLKTPGDSTGEGHDHITGESQSQMPDKPGDSTGKGREYVTGESQSLMLKRPGDNTGEGREYVTGESQSLMLKRPGDSTGEGRDGT